MSKPWSVKVKASDLSKVSTKALISVRYLGEVAAEEMRDRVQRRHLDARGMPLPPYKVPKAHEYSAQSRRSRSGETRSRGKGWDVTAKGKSVSPDLMDYFRKVGGVFKSLAAVPDQPDGAEPVYYSERCPDKNVRGQQWGWRWPTKESFEKAYGKGRPVDYTDTGKMWKNQKVQELVQPGGDVAVKVGFRGAVGRNVFESHRKARARAKKSGRKFVASPAIKAALCDMRSTDGKMHYNSASSFAGLTDSEMQTVLDSLNTEFMRGLQKVPVSVIVKTGPAKGKK